MEQHTLNCCVRVASVWVQTLLASICCSACARAWRWCLSLYPKSPPMCNGLYTHITLAVTTIHQQCQVQTHHSTVSTLLQYTHISLCKSSLYVNTPTYWHIALQVVIVCQHSDTSLYKSSYSDDSTSHHCMSTLTDTSSSHCCMSTLLSTDTSLCKAPHLRIDAALYMSPLYVNAPN